MFDRANIKLYAKNRLRMKHFMVVLILLITFLLGGTLASGAGGAVRVNVGDPFSGWTDTDADTSADAPIWANPGQTIPGYGDQTEDFTTEFKAALEEILDELDAMLLIILPILAILVVLAIGVALALTIFLGNVMTVGAAGWLLRFVRGEMPPVSELFACFRIYKPTVLTMLLRGVYTFLWSLLFLIPGIVKSYAYSMVPYIIYENPNLTANQAIKMSKKMTDGYKFELFVLNLSFFGWVFLSAITGGLVGIFYANPYMGLTHAGTYDDLKWKAIQAGKLTWADFGQTAPAPADVFADAWTTPVPAQTPQGEVWHTPTEIQ